MTTTAKLSKAIQDLHAVKIEGIRKATRAKYIDLIIGTLVLLVITWIVFAL